MKTIRDILDDKMFPSGEVVKKSTGKVDPLMTQALVKIRNDNIDQALKELEEIILESLPEAPSLEAMKHAEDSGDLKQLKFMLGYQSSLEDTKANLLKKLGGKE